jgi:hypothetical protein
MAFVAAVGAWCAGGAVPEAAAADAPPPPKLEPLPEPPPPPPGVVEQDLEPQITIIQRDAETVEEYRVGGRLVMIKVTPRGSGVPYYLVDEVGDGRFIRRESFETGLRVPLWLLFSF